MTGSSEERRSALRVLVFAGSLELVLLTTLGWWGAGAFPWIALLLIAGAFAAYGRAAMEILDTADGHVTIWIFAILMRFALLLLDPELSHDIYRYLWDGEVQLHGISPYRYAPVATRLGEIVTPYQTLIPDPTLHSVHPPLAQVFFLLIAAAGGAVFQAKLLWMGLDLGTAWLLGRVSMITGRSRRLTQLLYLWSPLLLIEVAWNGNLAPVGLFALVLIVLVARAPASAGAATALASMTALAPALAVPAMTARLGMRFLAGFVITVALVSAPYALAREAFVDALTGLANRPDFMSGPYALFDAVLPGALAPRAAVGILLLAIVIWTAAMRYRPERTLFWILGAGIVLTPTLRPSYLLWLLPLAALRANRTWLIMTGLVMLTYLGAPGYFANGEWPQPWWLRLAIWIPFLIMLVFDGAKLWEERVPKPLSEPVKEPPKRGKPAKEPSA